MGYSARYHAVSLVAVFIALAIGILIGAEFGDDALNNTRRDLEHSLVGARAHLSRDFRVPKAVHLQVGDDARISVS